MKLLIVLPVVAFLSVGVSLLNDWLKRRRVLKARLAIVEDDTARLQPGFDDRPECPRGHGHMERISDHAWWCSSLHGGCGCMFRQQCRCGAWIPEDWTGCVVCGRKRPRSLW